MHLQSPDLFKLTSGDYVAFLQEKILVLEENNIYYHMRAPSSLTRSYISLLL